MLRPTCPCVGAARYLGSHRTQVRVRHSAMRRLHRACGRRAGTLLSLAWVDRRARDHDHRGRRRLRGPAPGQKAWLDLEVVQCGYCQSGQTCSATALLNSTPHPEDPTSMRPWRETFAARDLRAHPRGDQTCCPSLTPHRGKQPCTTRASRNRTQVRAALTRRGFLKLGWRWAEPWCRLSLALGPRRAI